jgi:phosphatidylserine decarboxylase
MITKLLKKYFSIVFVLATLIGVFHHHGDLKQHNDCKICTIQSSIADADTPVDMVYISKIDISSQAVIINPANLHEYKKLFTLNSRAPPKIS